MKGRHALAYMLIEDGRIVAIRDKERRNRIDYDDWAELAVTMMICPQIYATDGWEIGTECPVCEGTETTSVRCRGTSLSNTALNHNPCCNGYDERPCGACERGIKWETEY
ncbi:hypothetical protein GSbR_30340 [Geobacter sp. SVR]|nr:hypothetical protein GSVR_30660 [Geobacter sp. SVR]GCF86434.1 hypothetical protein GSbR_30340 [Geobacter sp. SVR]